ncbi:hypothetical protein [Sphingobium sp.]|uniref:hypothetical protein n=1 Tax=Sphingobium sp. TaxID=1912891 RepID=UPI000C37ED8F|nr:hypothetical protein [Sphingobium sp.]MBS87164.1 hypothetical protein [Sphingobium sp.]
MTLTTQSALDEAPRKARRSCLPPSILFLRAKIEFDQFDALSRTRALTDDESRAMERAMRRMQDWEAAL